MKTLWITIVMAVFAQPFPGNIALKANPNEARLMALNEALQQLGQPLATQITVIEVEYGDFERAALVYYQSPRGEETISLVQSYASLEDGGAQAYKCFGDNCTCKNVNIIGTDGTFSIKCSCTTCIMMVVEIPLADIFFIP